MLRSNLAQRVVTATIGMLVVGAVVMLPDPRAWAGLLLVTVFVALTEYTGMLMADRPPRFRAGVVASGLAFTSAMYLRSDLTVLWGMSAVMIVSIMTLLSGADPKRGAATVSTGIFGIFYFSMVMSLAFLQRDLPDGRWWAFVAMGVTFAGDTAAYFVGRSMGRRKLAPLISPGKTVEGALGGLVATMVFMLGARATFFPALSATDCLVIGVGAAVLAPLGDLVESMLKRSAGAKDSGGFMPGHGGMMDRMDAVLFVGSFVYAYARFFHQK